jgi:hypothetical protein
MACSAEFRRHDPVREKRIGPSGACAKRELLAANGLGLIASVTAQTIVSGMTVPQYLLACREREPHLIGPCQRINERGAIAFASANMLTILVAIYRDFRRPQESCVCLPKELNGAGRTNIIRLRRPSSQSTKARAGDRFESPHYYSIACLRRFGQHSGGSRVYRLDYEQTTNHLDQSRRLQGAVVWPASKSLSAPRLARSL